MRHHLNASAVRIERLERRRLLSAVFKLGDEWAFTAGGHGVNVGNRHVVEYLQTNNVVAQEVESEPFELPPGVTPYSDPDHPWIIGIDEDGLVIVRSTDEPADDDSFPDPVLIPPIPPEALPGGHALTSASVEQYDDVESWMKDYPGYIDKDGLRIVEPLPDYLAAKAKRLPNVPLVSQDGHVKVALFPEKQTDQGPVLTSLGIGSGLNIILNKSSALLANTPASAAFDRAAAFVETMFDDPINVYIDANVSELGGTIAGSTTSVYRSNIPYSTLRTWLMADNDSDEAIVDSLPTSVGYAFNAGTTFSIGNYDLTNANALALGQARVEYPSEYGGLRKDGKIEFDDDTLFDYDPTDGTTVGRVDFFSVAVHEILHLLGFESSVDLVDWAISQNITTGTVFPVPLDLFRMKPVSDRSGTNFGTAPRLLTTGSGYAAPVLYDGAYNPSGIQNFPKTLSTGDVPVSTGSYSGDGFQASHFKNNSFTVRKIGLMDPQAQTGLIESPRAIDRRMLGLIGWDVSTTGAMLSDDGTLRLYGTSAADTIQGLRSSNSTGGKTFTAQIAGIDGYFNDADISLFSYIGQGGNDTLIGTTRDERFYGGDGADEIDAASGNDLLYGENDSDPVLAGGGGNDTIYGQAGADTIGGGDGNDSLLGGAGNDYIEGLAGNDTLKGEGDIDRMFGNDGDDRFYAFDELVDQAIYGGPGDFDEVDYDLSPNEVASITSIANNLRHGF